MGAFNLLFCRTLNQAIIILNIGVQWIEVPKVNSGETFSLVVGSAPALQGLTACLG